MPNEKNLIPFSERTESEQREISSKAGKKSGESRRRKKTMKQVMKALLEMAPGSEDILKLKEQGFDIDNLDKDFINNMFVINAALFAKAKEGNLEAVKMVLEIIGQDSYKNQKISIAKKELELKERQIERNDW